MIKKNKTDRQEWMGNNNLSFFRPEILLEFLAKSRARNCDTRLTAMCLIIMILIRISFVFCPFCNSNPLVKALFDSLLAIGTKLYSDLEI